MVKYCLEVLHLSSLLEVCILLHYLVVVLYIVLADRLALEVINQGKSLPELTLLALNFNVVTP